MRRAARYDGVVPVRGDLLGTLSPAQVQEMLDYIKGFRPANTSFDVVHFGSTAGLQMREAGALVSTYDRVGVTWWLETLPLDAQLEQTLDRIRLGPPR
jgi:hypothetical protein